MKTSTLHPLLLLGALALSAGLRAADPTPADDVVAAARKLADQPNYAWKQTVENAGGNNQGRGGGPVDGRIQKGGAALLVTTRGDNKIESVIQGAKGVIKLDGAWKTADEAAADNGGGGPNAGRFFARTVRAFRAPAAQAEYLAGKAPGLKKTAEAITGDLSEDAAKELLTMGPRGGGGDGPTISGASGSVTFWLKDGQLARYAIKVKGHVSFNGNDRDVDRTTTVEIKDVGTSPVEVPADAAKKLGA